MPVLHEWVVSLPDHGRGQASVYKKVKLDSVSSCHGAPEPELPISWIGPTVDLMTCEPEHAATTTQLQCMHDACLEATESFVDRAALRAHETHMHGGECFEDFILPPEFRALYAWQRQDPSSADLFDYQQCALAVACTEWAIDDGATSKWPHRCPAFVVLGCILHIVCELGKPSCNDAFCATTGFKVGDQVECRSSRRRAWKNGVVISIEPLKVKRDGWYALSQGPYYARRGVPYDTWAIVRHNSALTFNLILICSPSPTSTPTFDNWVL